MKVEKSGDVFVELQFLKELEVDFDLFESEFEVGNIFFQEGEVVGEVEVETLLG